MKFTLSIKFLLLLLLFFGTSCHRQTDDVLKDLDGLRDDYAEAAYAFDREKIDSLVFRYFGNLYRYNEGDKESFLFKNGSLAKKGELKRVHYEFSNYRKKAVAYVWYQWEKARDFYQIVMFVEETDGWKYTGHLSRVLGKYCLDKGKYIIPKSYHRIGPSIRVGISFPACWILYGYFENLYPKNAKLNGKEISQNFLYGFSGAELKVGENIFEADVHFYDIPKYAHGFISPGYTEQFELKEGYNRIVFNVTKETMDAKKKYEARLSK